MKVKKFTILLSSLLVFNSVLFADVNFSGIASISTGFKGEFSQKDTIIPVNSFASAQMNINSWAIFRASFELSCANIANEDIFKGQNALLKTDELSLVLIKSGITVKNHFGFFIGNYECVGQDEFFQRQFGIAPISSIITKNKNTLSNGFSLYNNEGYGFNYTLNFAKTPGAIGFTTYINKENSLYSLKLDARTAWVTKLVTFDLAGGISAPLYKKYEDKDVALLIDTLYAHAGLSILIGNVYTHGLYIAAGFENLPTNDKTTSTKFDTSKDLSVLVETRIYTNTLKIRVTGYSIPENSIKQMLYLKDPLGGVFTIYSDVIPFKNNNMTLGCHLISSIKDNNIIFKSEKKDSKDSSFNIYLTPYMQMPLANGDFLVMAQIGACDVTKNLSITYDVKVGYKKVF